MTEEVNEAENTVGVVIRVNIVLKMQSTTQNDGMVLCKSRIIYQQTFLDMMAVFFQSCFNSTNQKHL